MPLLSYPAWYREQPNIMGCLLSNNILVYSILSKYEIRINLYGEI